MLDANQPYQTGLERNHVLITLLCSQLDQYSQAESTVDEVVVTTESEPNHIIDRYAAIKDVIV